MTKIIHKPNEGGSALLLTLMLTAIALLILANILYWSSSSALLTHHSIQYNRSIAAGEAATEKVLSQMRQDFLYGGDALVVNNLGSYRAIIPSPVDSPYWTGWQFDDGNGGVGQTYVLSLSGTSYTVLDSTYAGLQGYVTTYTVASHASDTTAAVSVNAGVAQQLQLTQIPIFQFAMYSSGNMEISCGQPFEVTGRVHSNQELFVEPDSALTFDSGVTAVVDILFQRDPLDPRGLTPNGTVVYENPAEKIAPVPALTLPIGTTNTPDAIRQIIEPPPPGEDPTSPLGHLRYYNECDMLIQVTDTGVTASSGEINGFGAQLNSNDVTLFVSTNNSFWDARESKTVESIDIDVGQLTTWSLTNSFSGNGVPSLGRNFSSVYVWDQRHLPGNELGAVRVWDGTQLPPNGLTVATGSPLYVWGNYNQTNVANLGTSNTTTSLPASFAADAVTILSTNWSDANSANAVGNRLASATTVNAALLTGAVDTTTAAYSGGMENFPRFLETWGSTIFTYNGSMIKMFPSLYATNAWNNNNNIYSPPTRNWAYDVSFDDPTKLPPKTPSLLKVVRSNWTTVPAGVNVASSP
ncbi:MAG TPA: hypothetical protein VK742_16475 [Candidatus Sulfotelmatobacter sp.]|jgi:hypothetical protein|nr:hypothetical protein [Candidatus Sulfotelmatobacter sp.]